MLESGLADAANHFNVDSQLRKYKLNEATFDSVDIDAFHNTRFKTICSYLFEWILMLMSWVLLASDIYTCVNILVFHRWSSDDIQPYQYQIAKWIYTGCIIFQFVLVIYRIVWAIYTVRTDNIALVYLTPLARLFYTIRSYNYHCFFNMIQQDNYLDWCSFFCYFELCNALQILVADAPRQVFNGLTINYYATGGKSENDILQNIKEIATTNLRLAILLSIMCVSIIIWSIFFFKFVFGMCLYPYVKVHLRRKRESSIKRYNCSVINQSIKVMVARNNTKLRNKEEEMILFGKRRMSKPGAARSTTSNTLNSYRNNSLVDPFQDKLSRSETDYSLYSQQKPQNPFESASTFYKQNSNSSSSLTYDRKPYVRSASDSSSTSKLSKTNVTTRSIAPSIPVLPGGGSPNFGRKKPPTLPGNLIPNLRSSSLASQDTYVPLPGAAHTSNTEYAGYVPKTEYHNEFDPQTYTGNEDSEKQQYDLSEYTSERFDQPSTRQFSEASIASLPRDPFEDYTSEFGQSMGPEVPSYSRPHSPVYSVPPRSESTTELNPGHRGIEDDFTSHEASAYQNPNDSSQGLLNTDGGVPYPVRGVSLYDEKYSYKRQGQ